MKNVQEFFKNKT